MDSESATAEASSGTRRPRRVALGCLAGILFLVCAGAALYFAWNQREEPDVAATAVIAEATESAPSTPTSAAEVVVPIDDRFPGRIAFTNDGQLGTVGSAGDDLLIVGEGDEHRYLFPAWAPDGRSIAVLGSSEAGSGVYVLGDEADGDAAELYFSESDAPIYIYWRPDGGAVSYIASGERSLNLWLSPPHGADEPLLLAEGQPLYWDWADENSRLLVHTGTPVTGAQLSFVEVDGTEQAVEALDEPGFFQAPGVSNGGAYVAFAGLEEGERSLTVSNIVSGERQSTEHQGIVAMGWSPTEQTLAFISPQERARQTFQNFYGPLRLLDAGTGDVTLLVSQTVLAFFWSPDGEKIAYFTPGQGEQVASAPSGNRDRTLGKVRWQEDELRLSLSVVHVENGGSQHVLDFRPTDLFIRQFLPFFDQYALSHRLWSPDSAALVLPILDDDRASIYVAPISGDSVRHVADGEMAFWSPR